MDPAKVAFLFDRVPEGFDLEDADDIAELIALDDDDPVRARPAIHAVVAEQILGDDPPAVWATAQRLLALGFDRDDAMAELTMALVHTAHTSLAGEGEGFDTAGYEAALALLPLPSPADIEAAALAIVAASSPISADDLDAAVLSRLGRAPGDPLAMVVVDPVLEALMESDGPLTLLAGDLVVDVTALTAGIVLTHRLSADERELDLLVVGLDLVGFTRRGELHLHDGTVLLTVGPGEGDGMWQGPAGWLQHYAPGALLAIRVDAEGLITLEVVGEEPAVDSRLVELVRTVYDEEVAEPWLPVAGEDLLLGILVADSGAFADPQPPLEELCAAAGLERRGVHVAHEESVWAAQEVLWRMHRVYDALDSEEECRSALDVLDIAESDDPSLDDLRRALKELQDAGVAEVVLAELTADRAARFSDALLGAATTPRQTGVARWVAAIVAEEAGEVEVAEAHLHLGLEADPSSGALVERCAWYASDRGRASEAVTLWHRLGARRAADIATVEPFARRSGPKLGRNDPCWCGSGRKYKSCHPGQQPDTPLPDRVGWLCRKATAYLEHGGIEARDLVMRLARCRATGADEDSVLDALTDPIVIDAALTEGGWFESFLEDRGPLLPQDETLLAQSWLLVPRSVYEVLEVRAGAGLRVRDVRTGDVVEVRERTFSREAQPSTFVCARAVPDGETHQFVGGLFPVAPGKESAVLALCEAQDPYALCDHVASLHRPPELRTREGEPIVACTAVLKVSEPTAAAGVLDVHYRRDGEAWVDMFPLSENEETLRATLTMDGDRLQVETHSEPRLERVLALLGDVLPDARVISDRRNPLVPGRLPSAPEPLKAGIGPDPEVLAEIQELMEQRWLDESVPALAGMTPRQAAADPTRRDELRRLIASFPSPAGLPQGMVTMRPARLRELLDL